MVGAGALEGFLKKHRKIGLDSSILIYFIQADLVYGDLGARLRATYRLTTPDSTLIATALNSEATGFIGNDADLKRVAELDVLVPGK